MTHATQLFARYNQHADQQLFQVLDQHDPEAILRPEGSYFTSILGLLNHTLLAGLNWLVRFRDGGIAAPALNDPVLEFEHPGWSNNLYEEYVPTRDRQLLLDKVFLQLTNDWDEQTRAQPFSFVTSRGEKHRMRAGEVLLHVFNHATHHRGQISQILDRQGVEHDFSNLALVLDEVD